MAVEGRLDWREWEAKDGSGKRQAVQIVANTVQFLGSRDGGRRWRRRQRRWRRLHPAAATSPPTPPTSTAPRPAGGGGGGPKTTSPSSRRAREGATAAPLRRGASVACSRRWLELRETSSRQQSRRGGRRGADRARPRKYTRVNAEVVDYKDLNLLRRFLSDKGKTRGRRVTGLSRRHQRSSRWR